MVRRILFATVAAFGLAWAAHDARAIDLPTAKGALALANAKVDTNAQNQVIVIEGNRSDSDLRPRQWDITMFDTNRVNNGLLVRVKDGAVVSQSGSVRMFDDAHWNHFDRNLSGYSTKEIVNLKRWKLDSDQILRVAQTHPKLAGLQVMEVVLTLRKASDGDVPPVWRIKVRARPQNNPRREGWIGYLEYNAENGELLGDELYTGSLLR